MNNFVEVLPILFMILIPVVAIVGGITAGIIRSHHRHRIVELAQRERIAAIERGLDLAQLPALGPVADTMPGTTDPRDLPEHRQLRQSRGLLVGGIITTCIGVAMGFILLLTVPLEEGAWGVGLFMLMLGVALLISARVLRPDPDDLRREKEWVRHLQDARMAPSGAGRPVPSPPPAGRPGGGA